MHGLATRLLLLLLAVAHCLDMRSPESTEKSSEGEDDDWEEHHDEYTYTELGDEESREGGLEKGGYHIEGEGPAGSYGGATWAGSKKSAVLSAQQAAAGATNRVKASSNLGAMVNSAKGKRRKASAAKQQSAAKKTKGVNKASQSSRKSSSASKKGKSLKKGAKGKVVRAGTKHVGGLKMEVKKNPKIWSSGASAGAGTLKGTRRGAYKSSAAKGSKMTIKVSTSKRKGDKSGKALRKGEFPGGKKSLVSKTNAVRRKGTLTSMRSNNTVSKGKKPGTAGAKSMTKQIAVKKSGIATNPKLYARGLFLSNSNAEKSNKSRLRGFVEKAIGAIWPAVKKKFGLKETEVNASAQRSPSLFRFPSKTGDRFHKGKVFNGSKKGKASSATVSYAHRKQAGIGSSAVKSGSRHLRAGQSSLSHNRTSWSGLGAGRGERRSRAYEGGFLSSSRSRRKKERAVYRVRRFRRRRRKHRRKRPVGEQRGLEQNSSRLEPSDDRLRNSSGKPEEGGGRLEKDSGRLGQGSGRPGHGGGRLETGSSQREHGSGRLKQDGGLSSQDSGQLEKGVGRRIYGSGRREHAVGSQPAQDSDQLGKGSSQLEHGSGRLEQGSSRPVLGNYRLGQASNRLEHGSGHLEQDNGRPIRGNGRPEQSSFHLVKSSGQPGPDRDRVPRRQTIGWTVRRKPIKKMDSELATPVGEIDSEHRNTRLGNRSRREKTPTTPKTRAKASPEIKEPAAPAHNLPVLRPLQPKVVAPRPDAVPHQNLPIFTPPQPKAVTPRPGTVPDQDIPALNPPRPKARRPDTVPEKNLPVPIPPGTEVVAPRPAAVPKQNLPALSRPRTKGVAPRPGAIPEQNLSVLNVPRTKAAAPKPAVVPDDNLPFPKPPRTKVTAHQPHAAPMQKLPVLNTSRTNGPTRRPEIARDGSPSQKAPLAERRRKLKRIHKAPGINSTTGRRKKFSISTLPNNNASAILQPSAGAQEAPDTQEPVVPQRPSKGHSGHHGHRCQSGSLLSKGKPGKIVGGGLMWFPAASCAAAGLDWNSVHSTACLHQQIAFVHRYKVLTPALHPVNDEYAPGFCGSYVPWNHVAAHHVASMAYDGSIVSGLSLHRFGFVNPGGYTFELLPHTGRLILVGVPFHRRALSLCHLDAPTLGLLFTGTGQRNGALGMQRLGQICGTLETYVKTKPSSLYWGFPTVPVRTAPVAVRVPDASTEAITPVLPIASDSAEEFALKVFTEPLALYPEVPVDYTETHTNFLDPVMFVTEPVEHVVHTRVETVGSPVIGAASETVAETVVDGGGGVSPVIETHEVEVVHPAVQTVHEEVRVITGPEVAVDPLPAVAQTADVFSDIDGGVNDVGYHADFDFDEPGTSYYVDYAEPVVHVSEQVLCFPGPAV